MIVTKRRLIRAAESAGVEPRLRQVQRALESGARRRNRRDDENLSLLLAAILMPDSTCIDIGANIGATLKSMLDAAPAGKHIAYEPLPALCADLRSRFPTVDVRQMALSNHTGEADFVHVTSLPSRSGLQKPDYDSSETEILRTPVATLDATLEPKHAPSLIKIDVEGAELKVLEGARRTIATHSPTIVFEHDARWSSHYATTSDDVYSLLCDDMSLRIFDMDGYGPYRRDHFVAAVRGRERWNFFARR